MDEPYFRRIKTETVLLCILWTTNGGKLTTDAAVRSQTNSRFLLLIHKYHSLLQRSCQQLSSDFPRGLVGVSREDIIEAFTEDINYM